MTARDQMLIKSLLGILVRMPNRTSAEEVLFQSLQLVFKDTTRGTFDLCTGFCETERWVVGVTGLFGNRSWSLTDAGQAALLQM